MSAGFLRERVCLVLIIRPNIYDAGAGRMSRGKLFTAGRGKHDEFFWARVRLSRHIHRHSERSTELFSEDGVGIGVDDRFAVVGHLFIRPSL